MKTTLKTLALSAALIPLTSCKVRTDSVSINSEPEAPAGDLFATCTNAGYHGGWELELRQDESTQKANIKYWKVKGPDGDGDTSEPALAMGVWENADERSPFEHLYAFGNLRMIITLERTTTGFYPATLAGKDGSGTSIDESLMCTIK